MTPRWTWRQLDCGEGKWEQGGEGRLEVGWCLSHRAVRQPGATFCSFLLLVVIATLNLLPSFSSLINQLNICYGFCWFVLSVGSNSLWEIKLQLVSMFYRSGLWEEVQAELEMCDLDQLSPPFTGILPKGEKWASTSSLSRISTAITVKLVKASRFLLNRFFLSSVTRGTSFPSIGCRPWPPVEWAWNGHGHAPLLSLKISD